MKELEREMDKGAIRASVREFIMTHFPPARNRTLRDADPLLESGIIDSLGVLDMIGFIESEFTVQVVDEELTPENFETIDRIAGFIDSKRKG